MSDPLYFYLFPLQVLRVGPALVELDWIALSLFWKAWTVEVKSSLLSSLMAIYVMGLCILFYQDGYCT